MTFPTLYHKAKTGKIQEWKIWTVKDTIIVEHGQQGGKKQLDKTVCFPKNVGKANATTANEQADAEAQSQWTYQRDRKYRENIEDTEEEVLLPMLAHKLLGEKFVNYPVDTQPKLEGVRCLAFWENGRVRLLSRGGKDYKVPHIQEELENILPKDVMLDGEIYAHGQPQQTINSWVKKNQPASKNLFYFVYDVPKFGLNTVARWKDRKVNLDNLFLDDIGFRMAQNVKQVFTFRANHREMVDMYHAKFVEGGFEGIIVRTLDGKYEFGHRSHSLLKLKNFQDEEFKIMGAKGGTPGSDEEKCVIWVCETKEKKVFDVRPRGTHESRKEMLKNASKYIGKMLTVRFQSWTNDKKPYFPVGIAVRLKEDM